MNRGKLWHSGPLTNGHSRMLLKVSMCSPHSALGVKSTVELVCKGDKEEEAEEEEDVAAWAYSRLRGTLY